MFNINNKFTAEEIDYISRNMWILSFAGAPAPQTQEDFDSWCEAYLRGRDEMKKEAERKRQKRLEKEFQPGYKANRNYKRHMNEIRKLRMQIEELEREIQEHESKAEYWENVYKKETGKTE